MRVNLKQKVDVTMVVPFSMAIIYTPTWAHTPALEVFFKHWKNFSVYFKRYENNMYNRDENNMYYCEICRCIAKF